MVEASFAGYRLRVNATELLQRIHQGEDSTLECKSAQAKLKAEDIGRTLCAFANTFGGLLVLGVEDDGRISGIGDRKQADELQRQISQVAQGTMPSIPTNQQVVELESHRVLVVRIRPQMAGRPFLYEGRCFVRDGNRTRPATHSEMGRLFVSAGDSYYDEEAIEDTDIDVDLDRDAAVAILKLAYREFREDALHSYLAALEAVQGRQLTVGGMLLFGRAPKEHIMGAELHAIRFPGIEIGTTTQANDKFTGTLSSQLRSALDFIRAHVRVMTSREGLERAATAPVVDEAVWVEALTNALSHRDYRSPSSTRLFVFDDRVEIINPGELLNRLTVDGIRLGGVSQLRNPHIARVLSLTRGRDNAALGVPEIVRRLRDAGLPEPEFDLSQGAFRLVIRTRGLV